MNKEYIELFKLIENILKQQKSQKLRGFNDYNMVNVVRKASHEVGMHSNVIFSLINPHGLHYQNDLFLNLFIEKVLGLKLKAFGKVFEVQAEEITNENRRIDFTIKSKYYFIGIEMKVNAVDLKNQISHYDEYLTEQADGQEVLMYYLTKDGKDALPRSKGSVDIKRVSFEKNILDWLNACQKEVRNITNLNIALEDYKNIVKKITNKYKGNVVSIENELLESKKHLITALTLDKEMSEIKGKLLFKFFEEIKDFFENKGFENINSKIKDHKRILTEKKCLDIMRCSTRHSFFGIFFDCDFGDNLYFNVEYGKGGLFCGIIRLNEGNIQPLEDRDRKRFKQGESYSKMHSRYWKNIGDIWNLDNDNILNFPNSNLKDEILEIIKSIKIK